MNVASLPAENPVLHERMLRRQQSDCPEIWDILEQIMDPEIPVISLWDLGVLQDVYRTESGAVIVTITPTYTGCPAMREFEQDIYKALAAAGYANVKVESQLSPAWTTDMMNAEGRKRLRKYGIAPPRDAGSRLPVQCPQCGADETRRISEFGSTPCKALYQCEQCKEPFDYFKCI